MADFLTSNELNAALENIFETADEYLILISPFIKLHDRYASALKAKMHNSQLKITVVFGKNENDFSKSMKEEDFNFFKEFPNIEVRYEKRLHAKYYANQDTAILTSMNLYTYSQDNNIEAGVLTNRKGILGSIASHDKLEDQAYSYFARVIDQSDLLFQKIPQYEDKMLGLSSRYTNSIIEVDKLSDFFKSQKTSGTTIKKEFIPPRQSIKRIGYCIRTGAEIPFNPKNPMCESAFANWKKFSNKDYHEKYCHFSGEKSNGETTFAKPILRKNWENAMKAIQ